MVQDDNILIILEQNGRLRALFNRSDHVAPQRGLSQTTFEVISTYAHARPGYLAFSATINRTRHVRSTVFITRRNIEPEIGKSTSH